MKVKQHPNARWEYNHNSEHVPENPHQLLQFLYWEYHKQIFNYTAQRWKPKDTVKVITRDL
jgi:hypothetical protein